MKRQKMYTSENILSGKQNSNIADNLKNVKHRIIVMSGKGGVGKSTVATHLASSLAHRGFQVGLLDGDIHGPSVPKMYGINAAATGEKRKGLDPFKVTDNLKIMSIELLVNSNDTPVIWRGPVKIRVIRQFLQDVKWGSLDFLIVDLPPGTGDEALTIAKFMPECDGVIIVTTPQEVALNSVIKSINFARSLKLPVLGLVENMSSATCNICHNRIDLFSSGAVVDTCKKYNIPLIARLPLENEISRNADKGSVSSYAQKTSQWTECFRNIVDIVAEIDTR
ncbi:ATPase-like, ParA/MinD [Methanosalsum zhilinae DSM 4017]|uniref:Iron-sulfur cluster carrier protein n=1 Tax=Methanosalsum zhilinae (strain DSM 4017 / NBRC 107636 / OCM 62 / WeN5) TaxID=679901 RepID=F7XNW9_METZD|nr:Mrp/NBP35 family ATP-binding protein [Methanosalsum zhilinae]AEH60159.1 ATPase-like, ParA/MinD [Methanosalsum zhilinae DSM 4017]